MSVLDRFDVIEVPRTFSIAEVKVLKNKVSFNLSTASELGYPPYVRLFISKDKTQLAVQPCAKEAANAMQFFKNPNSGKKRRRVVSVGNRALTSLIKAGMGYEMSKIVCAPGIRFGDENVIIFDLKQSYDQETPAVEKRLCIVPRPALPFQALPAEYFSDGDGMTS